MLVNLMIDSFHSYEFLSKLGDLSSEALQFLRPQIYFRIFTEKLARGIKGKIKEKQCITVGSTYCVLYSEGNEDLDFNLANIAVAQICIIEQLPLVFYEFQSKIRQSCFLNSQIKPDFDSCFEQQLLALSSEEQKQIVDCKSDASKLEKLIDKHQKNQQFTFVSYSPFVFINQRVFKGNYVNLPRMIETVCGSYQLIPRYCKENKEFKQIFVAKKVQIVKFVLFSATFSCLIILMSLLIFYILMKKRMDSNYKSILNRRIQEALARYYEEEESKEEEED